MCSGSNLKRSSLRSFSPCVFLHRSSLTPQSHYGHDVNMGIGRTSKQPTGMEVAEVAAAAGGGGAGGGGGDEAVPSGK